MGPDCRASPPYPTRRTRPLRSRTLLLRSAQAEWLPGGRGVPARRLRQDAVTANERLRSGTDGSGERPGSRRPVHEEHDTPRRRGRRDRCRRGVGDRLSGPHARHRPVAVVLVDLHDWPAALAASTLAGSPLHAPLLYSEGLSLPQASAVALATMKPTAPAPSRSGRQLLRPEPTQVIEIGRTATPAGFAARSISGADPAALAVAIEQTASIARRRMPHELIVTASEAPPAMTMPAAGLAAQTGAPILFVEHSTIPRRTATELRRLGGSSIYLVGPSSVVSRAC